MAPFDLPVTQEVADVAEDGEDAVAHVCEDGHQHGRLLERLDEGSAVQPAAMPCCPDLCTSQHVKHCIEIKSYLICKLDNLQHSAHDNNAITTTTSLLKFWSNYSIFKIKLKSLAPALIRLQVAAMRDLQYQRFLLNSYSLS